MLAILGVFAAGVWPAGADHGPLTTHDTFSSPTLTPGKGSKGSREALEVLRSGIGRLELRARGAGPGKGFPNDVREQLSFPFFLAPNIFAIQAVVRVIDARITSSATPCGGTGQPPCDQVRAELIGGFYGDGRGAPGTATTPLDLTGDVFGTVAIRKIGPTGSLEVVGFASQCKDAQCTATVTCLGSFKNFGTVARGVPVTLLVEWDGQRMIFKRGTAPGHAFVPPTAFTPVSDTDPTIDFGDSRNFCVNIGKKSNTVFKALRNRVFAPTANAVGDIRATFDNVRIFQTTEAYPYLSYPYYGASLFGPVRPFYAGLSLALVAGLVLSQVGGFRRFGRHGRPLMLALLAFGLVLLATVVPSGATHLPLTTHDTFSGSKIDASKWSSGELERERRILGGQLKSSIRVRSRLRLENTLTFPYEDADRLQTIRAKVRALRFSGGRSDLNPTFPEISDGPRAGLRGFFFNDGRRTGGSGVPGGLNSPPLDQTGDVQALLEIRNNPKGGLLVSAVVTVCDSPSCSAFRTCFVSGSPGPPAVASLGRIFPGQVANLTLDWDGKKFTFRRAGVAPVTFAPPVTGIPPTASDLGTACFLPQPTPAPNTKFKGLTTRGFMSNTTTPYGVEANATALFDDVAIYLSPYGADAYGYFPLALMGPVRPTFAWASLALVAGLVVSQFAGWRRRRPRG